MCGVCGIWGRDEAPRLVEAMMRALRHRGPDDSGIYADGRVILGHTRLAILDVSSAGHQPMPNRDQSIWLNYNGELYNFSEEKAALEKRGERFASGSDTEVVLRLYEVYGDGFLQRLRGIFALAIYDRRGGPGRERLLLARDHLGVKPLLYAGDAQRLLFASELKALLASHELSRQVAPAALEDLLAFGSIAQPNTIISGVRMLPPAHKLVLESGTLRLERYWKLDAGRFAELAGMAYADQVGQLRTLLEETVRMQMVSDVPVGAFLSGGIDSTVLAALMARLSAHRLRTFSVGFQQEGARLDETDDAARAAAFLGTEHRRVVVTGEDVRARIEDVAASLDQPSVDGVNSYFVSAAAAGAVKVAVSGTGGDELFAGYPWFAATARAAVRLRPGPAQSFFRLVHAGLESRIMDAIPGNLPARALERARATGDLLSFFARQYQIFGTYRARKLLAAPHRHTLARLPRARERFTSADELPGASLISRVSALCLRGYAQNQLLRDIDAVSMAHSLEVRVPLLDPVLADFALSLPDAAKLGPAAQASETATYRQSGSKRIFIDAAKDLLPPGLDLQRKRGFGMPFDAWLRGPLADVLSDALSPRSVAARGLLDAREVSSVYRAFMAGRAPWSMPWLLMMVELWCRTVLDA